LSPDESGSRSMMGIEESGCEDNSDMDGSSDKLMTGSENEDKLDNQYGSDNSEEFETELSSEEDTPLVVAHLILL
jgi:hypothetical protein